MRQRTDPLGRLVGGYHLQQALDATTRQAEPDLLVSHWPKPLTSDGKVKGKIRTAQGPTVAVWVTYSRRKGQRVWLFCNDTSNPGFPVSCPVISRSQHWPPEMSCRCGRALGIAEHWAW